MAGVEYDSSTEFIESERKRKGPSRIYFIVLSVVYFMLLLVSVVALGSFGVIQQKLSKFNFPANERCILFGTLENGDHYVRLSKTGTCGYVLWGLVSLMLLSFVWLVYSIVLAVFGRNVISVLRILDFLATLFAVILSFSLSITITAGLDKTCKELSQNPCSNSYIHHQNSNLYLYYYQGVHSAQLSSWVVTVMLFFLSIWNCILMIVYMRKQRKVQHHHEEISSNSSSELGEAANLLEKERPFTNHYS